MEYPVWRLVPGEAQPGTVVTGSLTPAGTPQSIHTIPSWVQNPTSPADPAQFQAWASALLEGFEQQVALALLNVSILGVKPFQALQQFGQDPGAVISTLISAFGGVGSGLSALTTSVEDAIADLLSGADWQNFLNGFANTLGHTGGEPYSAADVLIFLAEIPGTLISGALNTAVTISGNALSTLFNASGFIASEIAGAINTAVTVSGNALSTLFNGSGLIASEIAGALNTAITISGNAISTLFNGSGTLASALTGAVNTAITISGNAISTLFNGSGLIASQIAGALNTAVTIGGTAISTLFQYLDSLGQFSAAHITGALNTAITVSGNAISVLFNGSGLIASQIAGALNTAITISGNAISSLFNSSGVLASIVNGALNTAVTISGNALSALFNSSGVLASVVNGALNTAVTISGNAISSLFNGSGVLASIVNGALNTAVTISGNAVSTLFNGSGVIASQIAGALNTAVTISGNAISTLFNTSGVLGSAINGAINTAATISGKALSTLFNGSGLIASQIAGALNTAVTISGNAVSSLFGAGGVLAAAISGVLGTGNIPNITLAMSTDLQGIANAIYNAVNNASATGKTVADALAALGSVFTGFVNALTGQSLTSAGQSDVNSAITGAAANTAANAAQINAAQTVLAPLPYGSISVTNSSYDFSTYANNTSAITGFTVTLTPNPSSHGTLGIVNGVAAFTVAGTTANAGTAIPTGVSTVTDGQLSSVVFPALVNSDSGTRALLYGRYKDINNWVKASFSPTAVQLAANVSGSVTDIGSAVSHTFQPGALYTLACGMVAGTRFYDILCNGASLTAGAGINDAGAISQVGATFRGGGFGMNAPVVSGSQVGAVTASRYSLADNVSLLTAPSQPAGAAVATSQSTSTTTYTDLGTVGPSVTVTIGSSGLALVNIYSQMTYSSGSGPKAYTSFVVSGANTQAASDAFATEAHFQSSVTDFAAGAPFVLTGLNPGSTTFKLQYRVNTGTCNFISRRISVVPL